MPIIFITSPHSPYAYGLLVPPPPPKTCPPRLEQVPWEGKVSEGPKLADEISGLLTSFTSVLPTDIFLLGVFLSL
jgi:hypothetical protein